MTRDEALVQLRIGPGINEDVSEEYDEAVDMAIEALEQQPSEDCVSREAVLSIIKSICFSEEYAQFRADYGSNGQRDAAIIYIKALPSVAPQPSKRTEERTEMHECDKVGHWIEPQQDDGMSDPIYYQVRCSECNFDLDPQTWAQELHQYGADKYCPRCGCRMQEVKK